MHFPKTTLISRISAVFAIALSAFEAGYCRADIVLGEYDFAGDLNASNVASGFIFSNLDTIQNGLSVLTPTQQESLETRGWPDNQNDPGGAQISLDDYFGFEITNISGNDVILSELSLQVRRWPDGEPASDFQIRGSRGGDFTIAGADILSHFDDTSSFGIPIMNTFGAPSVFNFPDYNLAEGTSFQFRFYAFSADNGSPSAPVYFDNINLSAVPEPCTLVFLGIASVALWTRRRRSPGKH